MQVNIGNKYNQQKGLQDLCKLHRGDFQNQPWEKETFDCAFAVEATCHSPDKVSQRSLALAAAAIAVTCFDGHAV